MAANEFESIRWVTMRASRESRVGAVGVTSVRRAFELLGWGPVEVSQQHDLGLDLLVQVRDGRGFDLGLFVAAQVKAGASAFGEPAQRDGDAVGWWFRDSKDHFELWTTLSMPALLVLYDEESDVAYWVHVSPQAVKGTGIHAKILVPSNQRLDDGGRTALEAVAVQGRAAVSWEGSAWVAAADGVPLQRRLRQALLTPRLLAPPRSAGYASAVMAEAGLALLVQGRVRDYDRFAQGHAQVPSRVEALTHRDWRWKFVGAFARWVLDGDGRLLEERVRDAPCSVTRTAALVAAVLHLCGVGEADKAEVLLDEEIARDEARTADLAWLRTHRAQLRFESARHSEAIEDAADAMVSAALSSDDPSASALRAGAAEVLLRAATGANPAVEDDGESADDRLTRLAGAGDTAAGWWRAQTVARALGSSVDEDLRTWVDGISPGIDAGSTTHDNLWSAQLIARLSGQYGAARGLCAVLARRMLVTAEPLGADAKVAEALELMRGCGDVSALEEVATRLWRGGPLAPLSRVVGQVAPERWTRSVGRGDLCLWQRAGDLLPEAAADAAIAHCVALVADPTDLERRTGGTFKVRFYALRALSGLGAAASACGRVALTDAVPGWVARFPHLHDELSDMIDLFGCRLEPNAASARAWQDTAVTLQHARLAHAMLGALTEPTAAVVDRLRAGAARGEARALSALNSFDLLDADTARAAIEHHTQAVETMIDQAQQGHYASRPDAPLDTLVHLGLRFPEHAAWPTVFGALASTHLLTWQTVGAVGTLADAVNRLAPGTRDELCALVRRMNASRAQDADGERVADRYDCLAVALDLLSPQVVVDRFTRRLNGDRKDRVGAVTMVRVARRDELLAMLIPLVSLDRDPRVRMRAAAAFGGLSARPAGFVVEAGLRVALGHPSAGVPLAALDEAPPTSLLVGDSTVRALVGNHPSAHVRAAARTFDRDPNPT